MRKRMLSYRLKGFAIVILICLMVMPASLSFADSSVGNITINSTSNSPVGQTVIAGGSVNLYFGNISWSSNTTYLLLSTNSETEVCQGDLAYTPTFLVSNISSTFVTTYNGNSGEWVVGDDWINGTIPVGTATGNYYVKAFDGSADEAAVTDTYLTVQSIVPGSTLNISPQSGPGDVAAQFSGSGYPASSNVTIQYYNPTFDTWNYFASAVASQAGQIAINSQIPDLEASLSSGDCSQAFNTISYRSVVNSVVYNYANYDEYKRGLSSVGSAVAEGLFGNGTDLTSQVQCLAGDELTISGCWFDPGVIYIRFDGTNVVSTVTASQWLNADIIGTTVASLNGTFSANVTIPECEAGAHFLEVQDSQTWIVVSIFVSPSSLSISPSSGPGDANVEFTGSKYPASSPVDIYYMDPTYGTWQYWMTTTSNSSGNIAFNAQMPDLGNSLPAGSSPQEYSQLSFSAEVEGTTYSYANYNENWRGLSLVGNETGNGLYGDGTNFGASVQINPGGNLSISGQWFDPGIIYVKLDGAAVVYTITSEQWESAVILGSTTASQTGAFQISVVIPSNVEAGSHFIDVQDSQTTFVFQIDISNSGSSVPPETGAEPQLSVVASGTTNSTVIPPQSIGSIFTVDVRVGNIADVSPGVNAVSYNLAWNSSVLRLISYSDVDWLPSQSNIGDIVELNSSAGTAMIGQIAFDLSNAWACTNEGGVSANFTFQVASSGSCTIGLQPQENGVAYLFRPAENENFLDLIAAASIWNVTTLNATYGVSAIASDNVNVTNGSANTNDSATGVAVNLSGSSAPNNTIVNITSTEYGVTLPSNVNISVRGNGPGYYDIKMTSNVSLGSNALASISISNPDFSTQSVISYWNGTSWNILTTTFTAPDTVSCNVSVNDLTGTPFAVSQFSLVDFYHTGTVNFEDIEYFVIAYIQYHQTGYLNPACDLNHDGTIDFQDIQLFVQYYIAAAQSQATNGT